MALAPDFIDSGRFFVNFTDRSGDTVVARFRRPADTPFKADPASRFDFMWPDGRRTIDQPFPNHNGGQLQFGPDGFLYVGMGDGGDAFDPQCHAQRLEGLLGKILRLDVDQNSGTPPFYGIPASNPFRGPGNPQDEVWATGLRNPWRFSFDRETGDLWIGDVGQNHREEVDFQSAQSHGGENYGWKVMEASLCTNNTASCPSPGTLPCNDPTYTPPVLQYDHADGCSVSGGYVYRGSRLPQLRGAYFFGDFCAGTIWLAAPQGTALNVRRLAQTISTVTSFGEDSQGELYLGTLDGSLYFLTSATGSAADRVGLYDPKASRFHLRQAGGADQAISFGGRNNGWLPVAGDWDGDGKSTYGFYDVRRNVFRLKNSLSGGNADRLRRVPAQPAASLAVTGDWNGDGTDTVGVYNPATGTFRLSNAVAGNGLEITFSFGPTGAGLRPLAGDWDGDGSDTVGVYDPATSTFYLANGLAGGAPDFQFVLGTPASLRPIAGDWNGDGRDSVGLYNGVTSTFQLRNLLSGGPPDSTFQFGTPRGGWLPLAGAW